MNKMLLEIPTRFETERLIVRCYKGAFDKETREFVAQVYVGVVNWDLPEFTIGYFADKDHEGQGFVTEAVRAALRFIFEHLRAHRVRLETNEMNTRSRRVAEHGAPLFECCATRHQQNSAKGKPCCQSRSK